MVRDNNKENVGAMVEKEYKTKFHARCIEYNTTMSKVIKDAMNKFMEDNPEKPSRYQGVV